MFLFRFSDTITYRISFFFKYFFFSRLTVLLALLKGIAKLPFIDEARLLDEVKKIEHTLTVWSLWQNLLMMLIGFFLSRVANC